MTKESKNNDGTGNTEKTEIAEGTTPGIKAPATPAATKEVKPGKKTKTEKGTNIMTDTNTEIVAIEAWTKYVAPFATIVGMDAAAIAKAVEDLVGEANEDAIAMLRNEEFTPYEDVKACFSKVPTAKLRMAISKLRAPAEATAEATANAAAPSIISLPGVPENKDLLAMLNVQGDLKVGGIEISSGIKGCLVQSIDVGDIVKKIIDMSKRRCRANGVPTPRAILDLKRINKRNKYSEILQALNAEGHTVTAADKKELIEEIRNVIFPKAYKFAQKIEAWNDEMVKKFPQMMMSGAFNMNSGIPMDPNMAAIASAQMKPSVPTQIRAAVDGFIEAINVTYSGTGAITARVIAKDALTSIEAFDSTEVMAHLGYGSREEMLRDLGVAVTSEEVRLEQDLSQFIWSIVKYPELATGQGEIPYIMQLHTIANQIDWDAVTNVGSSSSRNGDSKF